MAAEAPKSSAAEVGDADRERLVKRVLEQQSVLFDLAQETIEREREAAEAERELAMLQEYHKNVSKQLRDIKHSQSNPLSELLAPPES